MNPFPFSRILIVPAFAAGFVTTTSRAADPAAPYPASAVVQCIEWKWDTYTKAAPGSDLWPVTWGPDDNLYTSWGDGGGFGGTDSDGRVALGFGRIEGGPEKYHGVNVNGGKNPEHLAQFPKKGKTSALICVDGVLYTTINMQDGTWPQVSHALAWSKDFGATWTKADWLFPKDASAFQPARFLNFGRDGAGAPDWLAGYVYLFGPNQDPHPANATGLYLARVPKDRLRDHEAYEYFERTDADGKPAWTSKFASASPVFVDSRGVKCGGAVYDPGLHRFLLTVFHSGPGQLGVFDAPNPWGPWTTVDYEELFGRMGATGEGLSCEFPEKWMSADGLTVWTVFSVYGGSAHEGIDAHDHFNLVKAVLKLR